mmetsp:Transcript_3439/g.10631  ORF Transcript_3439/g.10631 Transcript_3439/m.10631 type:complete len:480 (+) Transcript_3439:162-1601(+)
MLGLCQSRAALDEGEDSPGSSQLDRDQLDEEHAARPPISFGDYLYELGEGRHQNLFVRVYGGYEAFDRIRRHLQVVHARNQRIAGERFIKTWKLYSLPHSMRYSDPPFPGPSYPADIFGGDLFSKLRKFFWGGTAFVTQISQHDRCATVAIYPKIRRCLIVKLVRGQVPNLFANKTAAPLDPLVQRAILISDDWLRDDYDDVFNLHPKRLIARFKRFFPTYEPGSSHVLGFSKQVIDALIDEAAANGFRLAPNPVQLNEVAEQLLREEFESFPHGDVSVTLSPLNMGLLTSRIDANVGPDVDFRHVVVTTDARIWRIIRAYVPANNRQRTIRERTHLARWLTLLVARCAVDACGYSTPDENWTRLMKCFDCTPQLLLHLVSLDVMPNLVSTLGMNCVVGDRSSPMCVRMLPAQHANIPQDLVSTNQQTATNWQFFDQTRDLFLAEERSKRLPSCVTPGTSLRAFIRGVHVKTESFIRVG